MRWSVIGLLAVLLCVMPCRAAEEWKVPGLEEFWEQAEDLGITREEDFQRGVEGLLRKTGEETGELLRGSTRTVSRLMAVVLLCGMAQGLQGDRRELDAVRLAGALAITALTMSDVAGMLGMGRETMGRMDLFSRTLLPVMAVLTAAAGSPASAAVRQGATVLFSQLVLQAMDRLLIPLVYAYVSICCASAALGTPGLDKLARLVKGTACFVLSGLLMAFVGYLSASGAVAGSVDAAAIKTAKLAITRVIPVVGGILADASETILSGAAALRGTVGAAGMLVVLSICAVPFLHLAVHYLAYKVTGTLCALVAQPGLSRLIEDIGGAFGMVLGMTGAAALVLLISLVSALSAVIP